ncbi:MAG: DUF5606 domain-containing protein [Paludibacteraceae bacterium]|nr:DUF5606 domain-containing protein [Paludibacteraceae bacterium]
MINGVLSISGKPGLFKLVSRGNNMLIVESLIDQKRQPAYGHEKIVSLADVAIYTENGDKPLSEVFTLIKEKENTKKVEIDLKDKEALKAYFASVLPEFDKERVYANDIKKVISWYNLLIESGETDFSVQEEGETADNAQAEKQAADKKREAKAAAAQKPTTKRAAAPKKTATVRKAGGNG